MPAVPLILGFRVLGSGLFLIDVDYPDPFHPGISPTVGTEGDNPSFSPETSQTNQGSFAGAGEGNLGFFPFPGEVREVKSGPDPFPGGFPAPGELWIPAEGREEPLP